MRVAVLSIAALALANPACAQLSTLPLRGGSKQRAKPKANPKAMSLKGTEAFVQEKTGMGGKGKAANSGRWRLLAKKKSAKKKSGMSLSHKGKGATSKKGMSGKGKGSKAGKLFKA